MEDLSAYVLSLGISLSGSFGLTTSDDIEPGMCLKLSDIQGIVGARSSDLYWTGECGVNYALAGDILEPAVCSMETMTGQWVRDVKEHPKFGFFFPKPVPCFSSVTGSLLEHFTYEKIIEDDLCGIEDYFASVRQTELYVTKKYKVGQGEMYLPDPLIVKRQEFVWQPGVGAVEDLCTKATLTMSYEGLGKMSAHWKKTTCDETISHDCKMVKFEASEDDQGNDCAFVKSVSRCL